MIIITVIAFVFIIIVIITDATIIMIVTYWNTALLEYNSTVPAGVL